MLCVSAMVFPIIFSSGARPFLALFLLAESGMSHTWQPKLPHPSGPAPCGRGGREARGEEEGGREARGEEEGGNCSSRYSSGMSVVLLTSLVPTLLLCNFLDLHSLRITTLTGCAKTLVLLAVTDRCSGREAFQPGQSVDCGQCLVGYWSLQLCGGKWRFALCCGQFARLSE